MARRRGLPVPALTVAAIAVLAGGILLFALSRSSNDSTPGSGAFVGCDLHSVVAMTDGSIYDVSGHDGVTVTRDFRSA